MRPSACRWVLLLLLFGPAAAAFAAESPCASDPRYRSLDPWLGEWRIVTDPDGSPQEVGRTALRSIVGGCAVEEVRQLADGSEQRALGLLDAASESWRQTWVNGDGDTGAFEVVPVAETLKIAGTLHLRATDQRLMVRSTLTPRTGGGFDEQLEISSDGGATYQAQPATAYLPLAAPGAAQRPPVATPAPERKAPLAASPMPPPAPTTPAPPAPAPAPAAAVPPVSSEPTVRLRSDRKADAPVAETAMQSPMTVEFELGPLADLPVGASWRTTELEPYVVDNVRMPRITANRRERRGTVTIELTVNLLLSGAAQAKVDLDASLLADGATVASAEGSAIALGKLIRSHDPEVGRPYSLEFELDATTFGELFAAGRRPTVRLTLGVR